MNAATKAFLIALGVSPGVLAGCGGSQKSPCLPSDLVGVEAAYTARMVAAGCVGPAVDTCKDGPALKAERLAEEKSGGCLK